jgi:hypothetical protein
LIRQISQRRNQTSLLTHQTNHRSTNMSVRDHWDALIAGGAAVFVALWNNRKINHVQTSVNGMKDELVRSSRIAGYGEGQQREREDQDKREEKDG